MANPETILRWLKEAGAYAYQLEELDRPGGRLLVDVSARAATSRLHHARTIPSDIA
jgi:hypothetical protein